MMKMGKNVFGFLGLVLLVPALILSLSCHLAPAAQRDLSRSPLASERANAPVPNNPRKLRIIAFGAHPDDCEIRAGGVAAMWAAQGHKVKFVSTTNGDIGHWKMAGGPLAQRRTKEVQQAAKILGIETQVLDNHDGELMPTLENRKTIVRLIREWKADIVMTHRTNDYHPDHRYTGVLVQDAAFMVICPFFCPDVPHLSRNPVFLYFPDRFQKPNPFEPDIVVAIDDVIDKKLNALVELESQFVEGCVSGHEGLIPKNEAERAASHRRIRDRFRRRFEATANKYRPKLTELYGEKKGKKVKCAEAFEVCEYGRQPSAAELKKLFPDKNYQPKHMPTWIIKENDAAARSNYIETFADAFKDPNALIGVFEWPARILPHRTRLSTGKILEDMPGYHEAMIRFSLSKLRCVKTIKGKSPELVVLVTTLPPPMIEARPSIPAFIPLLGSKWVLALKKTSKEYRISRFGGQDVEKYKFINDRTMFRVFRYGHGALCLKWSDYKKMLPKLPESPKPSHLVEVPENIVEDLEAIQRVIPYTRKEKKDPNEMAAITNTSKALKTDVAKFIFAKLLRG